MGSFRSRHFIVRWGNYSSPQEKIGNIVVRQKSKTLLGADVYKGLGIASFSLDAIATQYRPTDLSLTLTQCPVSGARVEIVVTPKFLGEVLLDSSSIRFLILS
jgi:hypothetical protein